MGRLVFLEQPRQLLADILIGGVYAPDVARDRVLDILPFGDPFSYPIPRYTLFSLPMQGSDGWSPVATVGVPPPPP